ncbi:MAG: OmpH family outer membrane protein [Alphaproteobacteria bacterium]|nr:OmpH family outer membrane protein [Alphaproteobacteria bacterium]
MKTTKALWAVAAFAATTFAFATLADAQPVAPKPAAPAAGVKPVAATGKAPGAIILFLDRGTVLRASAVGTDMYKQVEALAKKMETDFAPENKKLQADVQALQNQAAVLSPEVRQQKVKELEGRRQAFQKKVQDRQAAIQAGLANSRTQVEKALGPILEKIMLERSANLLLDRGLVVLGATDLDVTTTVIQRLNVALPKVTVTPVAPKAAAAPKPGAAPKPPGG